MNTQYRKNLKDVATACKNYTDKRFDDFKWELGTHTIDTTTDSDVAYQKQAPNGTIGCQIEKVGGMSYKSENLWSFGTIASIGGSSFSINNLGLTQGTYTIKSTATSGEWVVIVTDSNENTQQYGNTAVDNAITFVIPNGTYNARLFFNVTNTNVDFMLNNGSTALPYQPYFTGIRDSAVTSVVANSTLNIPASIQALTGYGWGINDTCYNYIDFNAKKFIQKVGRVDLGSLNWSYITLGSSNVFTASISNFKSAEYSNLPNILCSLYQVITRQQMEGGSIDFSVCVSGGTPQPLIANSNYSEAATFKNAMNGVYLYYELATPVETDISSYITDNDKFLEVEPLGTITFTNTYEQEVPSEITYLTEVAK